MPLKAEVQVRLGWGRRLGASLLAVALLAFLAAQPASTHVRARLAATTSGWLDRLNLWRANAGLSPLTENTTWSTGDYDHSVYMVKNDLVTHYETPGTPYYTVDGDTAARNGNLVVSSTTSYTDEQAIDWWMGAPFHALGMMDPRLTTTGYGSYREVKSGWDTGATLDTLRGNSFTGGTYPVFFPGNGTTEPLTNYSGGEYPDPLQACPNYTMPVGLPIFIQVGGNVATTAGPVHTLTGNGTPLAHCVIDSNNSAVGSNLTYRGAVVVIPERPLQQGVNYVVTLTVNNVPYTWSFTVGPFANVTPPAGWTSMGGILTSSAGASSWGASRIDVFGRGLDNAMYQTTWNGSAWGSWTRIGGVLTSSPGAVSWSANRIDAFVRGQDNALWHTWWTGSGWSSWEYLGGYLTSGPTVASWTSGRLDVFVVGSDRALWHKYWAGFWSGWQSLGGVLTSDPTAVSWGLNRIDVFARGQDNAMWQRTWDGSQWVSWQSRGGVLASGPTASSCASGHLDVFAVGSDSALYQMGYNGTWGSWNRLGGVWTTQPGAICAPGTTSIHLFERTADSALWQTTVTGS